MNDILVTKAAVTQNEIIIPSLHCLCMIRTQWEKNCCKEAVFTVYLVLFLFWLIRLLIL